MILRLEYGFWAFGSVDAVSDEDPAARSLLHFERAGTGRYGAGAGGEAGGKIAAEAIV